MNKLVNVTIDHQLTLVKSGFTEGLINQIRTFLTLNNPKYLDAKKHDRYIGNIKQHICAYHEDDDNLYCFRGYMGSLIPFLRQNGYQYRLIDKRRKLSELELVFGGTLREYQQRAITETLQKDFGVLVAPCGSGKTVMACAIIVERRQRTLIIVHTKELQNQWVERIGQYLGISSDEIGIIGSGKEIIRPITIGMIQTLRKRDLFEIKQHFGFIIVDEAHHTSSATFTNVVAFFDAYYMLGLSATPYRRDKLDKLIYASLGNLAATVKDDHLQQAGIKIKPEVIVRETGFDFDYLNDSKGKLNDAQHIILYRLSQSLKNDNLASDTIKEINSKINSIIYQPMISTLVEDADRNQLIADDIAMEAQDVGNSILVLSDRKLHLAGLESLLKKQDIDCKILTADVPKQQREQIIRDLDAGVLRVVLATGQLAGEGLDIPRLNRLFITTPIKWRGRITQYVGRILRTCEGKHNAKIYDYLDMPIILKTAYWSRRRVYRNLGGTQGTST